MWPQTEVCQPGKLSQALKSRVLTGAELCKCDWLNPWPLDSFPSPFSWRGIRLMPLGCLCECAGVALHRTPVVPLYRRSLAGVRASAALLGPLCTHRCGPHSRRCTQRPPVGARDPPPEPPVPDPLAPVSDYCAASEHPVESAFSICPSYLRGNSTISVHA